MENWGAVFRAWKTGGGEEEGGGRKFLRGGV